MSGNEARPAIRYPRIAEMVAGDLRRQIVSGELGEGDSLPLEAELIARYGVSRPTLREAIRILESQSLIAVTRGSRSGALVQPPDIKVAALHAAIRLQLDGTTLADVFAARIEIGLAAARLLASRPNRKVIAQLRRLHAHELGAAHDSTDYALAVTAFHAAVVESAGNQTLALVRNILEEIALAHERALGDVEGRWMLVADDHDQDDHTQLIELLAAGDVDAVDALWRTHLERSTRHILDRIGPTTVVNIVGRDGLGPWT